MAAIALLILLFSVQSYRGGIRAIQRLNDLNLSEDSLTVLASANDALFRFLKEKAFLQASLALAGTDSIGLSIDLQDSTVNLLLKGVVVHSCRMDGFRISPVFNKIDRPAFLELSSKPQAIAIENASILKEPIRTIKAPKSEEEAAIQANLAAPDTTREYVALRLETKQHIVLAFEQAPGTAPKSARNYHQFLKAQKNTALWELRKNLLSFKPPVYKPWIKIYLPPEEVKSIYRALPVEGNVILKL